MGDLKASVDASTEYTVLAQTRMRRAIGARMRESAQSIPHVTLHRRCEVSSLLEARRVANAPTITLTALLAAVVSRTVARHPHLNGVSVEGEVRNYRAVNLGTAVSVEGGLVVPVLHDCAQLPLQVIAKRLAELVTRARAGRLAPPELSGGTFTVTNLGNHDIEYFTPIVNAPQLAILGVGSISNRIVMRDGLISEQPTMYLSLSFDHAAVDGAPAAAFLSDLASSIERVACEELSLV